MQKPLRYYAVAFLFITGLLTGCESYTPKSTNNSNPPATVYNKPVSTQGNVQQPSQAKSSGLLDPGLPAGTLNEQVVRHLGYTLSYNEEHELASWVAYTLKVSHLSGKEKRSDDFRADPAVRTGSAEPDDYKYSGYDRGHLAPAGDMKWSRKAMSESFLMSNIAPQARAFNAGIWETLESTIRGWARKDSALHIVTGPVLYGNLQIIGKNKVTVPEYYYKAVLDAQEPVIKCIAFVIPNRQSSQPLKNYAISVDSLEAMIKLDLFPGLPDDIENEIEKNLFINQWQFGAQKTYRKTKKPSK